MTDLKKVSINFDEVSFTIHPDLTEDEFRASPLYSYVRGKRDYGNIEYSLTPLHIDRQFFFIVLYFDPNKLISAVMLTMTDTGQPENWADWSEEKEFARFDRQDAWLKERVGSPPYEYTWGGISSKIDPRSAESSITIGYGKYYQTPKSAPITLFGR